MPDRTGEHLTRREKILNKSTISKKLMGHIVVSRDWYDHYFKDDVEKEEKSISQRLIGHSEVIEELSKEFGKLFKQSTSGPQDARHVILVLWTAGYQLADSEAVGAFYADIYSNLNNGGFINELEIIRRERSLGNSFKAVRSAQNDVREIMLKGAAANIPGAVSRLPASTR